MRSPRLSRGQSSKILTLAWPAILEMLSVTAIWTVDTALVGRLGATALSAVGLGGQWLFAALWLFGAVGIGAASLIARHIGAEEYTEANQVATQAMKLAMLTGLLVLGVGWGLAPRLVGLLTRDAAVYGGALTYFRTRLITLPLMLGTMVASGALRASGNTRVPLLVSVTANATNIGLDYLLIFGHLGAPRLGVFGAAVASAVAEATAFLIVLTVLVQGGTLIRLRWSELLRWRTAMLRSVAKLSLPAALEEGANNGAHMLFVLMITALGTTAYAANTVTVSIESLSFMPGHGFAVASSALVGQAIGARRRGEAVSLGWSAMRLALLGMGGLALVFLLAPAAVVRIFTNDPAVVPLAAACLRMAALEQPVIAIQMTLAGALRGAGDTRTPLYSTLLGLWLVRLPLTWLAVYRFGAGISTIWLITASDWTVRSAVLAWHYARGKWARVKPVAANEELTAAR